MALTMSTMNARTKIHGREHNNKGMRMVDQNFQLLKCTQVILSLRYENFISGWSMLAVETEKMILNEVGKGREPQTGKYDFSESNTTGVLCLRGHTSTPCSKASGNPGEMGELICTSILWAIQTFTSSVA